MNVLENFFENFFIIILLLVVIVVADCRFECGYKNNDKFHKTDILDLNK